VAVGGQYYISGFPELFIGFWRPPVGLSLASKYIWLSKIIGCHMPSCDAKTMFLNTGIFWRSIQKNWIFKNYNLLHHGENF
jgi:hypothetical protein